MKRKGIGVELLHLHYFRKVAQTGHMSRAARELHISQPALSQTIARLEKELGAPLFDREGRRIRLNAYGEAFLEEVEKALAALEEGKRKVADMAGLERGVISLDATFLPHFPDVMQAFLRLHPDVRFNMSQAPSKKAKEELLASGRIDCCISCSPVELKGCRNEPIKTEHIVLAVPAGQPAGRARKHPAGGGCGRTVCRVQEGPAVPRVDGRFVPERRFCSACGVQGGRSRRHHRPRPVRGRRRPAARIAGGRGRRAHPLAP